MISIVHYSVQTRLLNRYYLDTTEYLSRNFDYLIFCIYFSSQYHHGHYFEISQFTGKKRDRTQSLWNRKEKRKNEKFYLFILFCWRAHFLQKINWAWCFLRNCLKLFKLELLKELFHKLWFKQLVVGSTTVWYEGGLWSGEQICYGIIILSIM